MKLDMDLIDKLLFLLEGDKKIDLAPYEQETLLYHKNKLIEAGLAKGKVLRGDDEIKAVALTELTWDGHQALNNARKLRPLEESSIISTRQTTHRTTTINSHALTNQQRHLLDWIVSKIRAKELGSEFLVGWVSSGVIIADYVHDDVPQDLTRGNLLILSDMGFLKTWAPDAYSLWCAIRQTSFDAFDSNFVKHSVPVRSKIKRFIEDYYDLEGIKDLCFELDIKYDTISGSHLSARARELVIKVEELGRFDELQSLLEQSRPIPFQATFG